MYEVHRVNREIVGVGPEIFGSSGHATEYLMHFLNASNHRGYKGVGENLAPSIVSYHWGGSAAAPVDNPKGGEQYFADWDQALNDPNGTVMMADAYIKNTGQHTEMVRSTCFRFWP